MQQENYQKEKRKEKYPREERRNMQSIQFVYYETNKPAKAEKKNQTKIKCEVPSSRKCNSVYNNNNKIGHWIWLLHPLQLQGQFITFILLYFLLKGHL